MKIHSLLAAALLVSGCAMLKTHDKDEVAVARIKTVALVGFTVVQPAPAEVGVGLLSGKVTAEQGGSLIPQNSVEVDEMYQELAKAFGRNVRWKVLPLAKLKSHPGYRAAFDRTMKGWQNKMPVPAGKQQYLVDGVMDNDGLRILGESGRAELMKALGVDAIITSKIDVMLKGTTVMGIGGRHPRSRLSFQVFSAASANPVWFEGAVDGEPAERSVGATGFFDEKLMKELSLVSARKAFQKIGKTPST